MAHPKSSEKRQAILQAAIEVFADQGLQAPTARIARAAGVAEGTIFTYFSTKDELLNQLYRELKREMSTGSEQLDLSGQDLQQQFRRGWTFYVRWGLAAPLKRKVLAQLAVSDKITPESREIGARSYARFHEVLNQCFQQNILHAQSPAFVLLILGALADATMDYAIQHPDQTEEIVEKGFEAFWKAVT